MTSGLDNQPFDFRTHLDYSGIGQSGFQMVTVTKLLSCYRTSCNRTITVMWMDYDTQKTDEKRKTFKYVF
jgi:hypothetical protein